MVLLTHLYYKGPMLSVAPVPIVDPGAVALATSSLPTLQSSGVIGDILNEMMTTFFGAPTGAIGAGGQLLLNAGLQIAAPFVALAVVFKGVKMSFGIK